MDPEDRSSPSISSRGDPNIMDDLNEYDLNLMSEEPSSHYHVSEPNDQSSPLSPARQMIDKDEMPTQQKISRADEFPSHLYAGSLIIIGRFIGQTFHTNGEEEELTLSYTNKTSLHLETSDYKRVKAEVLFASYMQDIISYKLAHLKFYFCIEADKQTKAGKSQQNRKSGTRQNKARFYDDYEDASEDSFMSDYESGAEQDAFPIRIDMFLTERVLSASFYESTSKLIEEDDEDEALRRVRMCQMLIYLLKKCNVKVLNKSLVVPPPKINLFMRHFRTSTIGHKKKCSRNPERLKNKIKSWKARIERAHTYYACMAGHALNKHGVETAVVEKQYEGNGINWDDRAEQCSELVALDNAKQKVERNDKEALTHLEKSLLEAHRDNNLREVGADMFISKQINITDDIEEGRGRTEGLVGQTFKEEEELDSEDEEENRKSNMELLRKFEEDNKYFQLHPTPSQIRTPLKPYQKQALQWMKVREGKLEERQLFEEEYGLFKVEDEFERKLSMFWEELVLPSGLRMYVNYLTGELSQQFKEGNRIKGGILADQMGLGKTLMMLSLIADESFEGTNLIVMPVTVMGEWIRQIRMHCGEGIKVLNFNDEAPWKRKTIDFRKYQIVLVTYSTLAAEFKGYEAATAEQKVSYIFSHDFRRVILDEAHQIRESNTLQFKATMNLRSAYKWCLTGTLIQNAEKDLFPILKFLGLEFFSEEKWWNQYIKNSVSFQSKLNIIYTILRPILLRRMKNATTIDLPQKQESSLRPQFSTEEQKLYKLLERGALAELDINMQGDRNYVYAFTIINKLREFCCHPKLVLGNYKFQDIEGKSTEEIIKQFFSSKLTEQFKNKAFSNILETQFQENCTICLERILPSQLTITKCGHIFCNKCIKTEVQIRHRCPFCRHELSSLKDMIKANEIEEEKESIKERDSLIASILENSSKMATILSIVEQVRQRREKCVIFTQWLSMISLLQSRLESMDIQYASIKGSMPQQKRMREIERFRNSEACEFIIISIRAGSTGINLQNANNVIVCDPWWNPSQEDQAIGRVHRLGQSSRVNVYKLYMRDSIQEKIERLNISKRVLSQQIMMNKESLNKKSLDVISELVQMMKSDHDEDGPLL